MENLLKTVKLFLLKNKYVTYGAALFVVLLLIFSFLDIIPLPKIILGVLPVIYLVIVSFIMPESYDKGFRDGAEQASEKQKNVKIKIIGVPTNKREECKEFLLKYIEQFITKDTILEKEIKDDYIQVKFDTLQSIANIRNSIISKFPINIVHDTTEVVESYKSMDAMGKVKFKTIVEGIATSGSKIVFDDDLNKTTIIADNNGKYSKEITIVITSEILQRGYIEGTAVKDGMTKRIKVDLDKTTR